MAYPDESKLRHLVNQFHLYGQLQHEYGAPGLEVLWAKAERSFQTIVEAVKALPVNAELAEKEPNDLASIRRLRPVGPRRPSNEIERAEYGERLEGALFGRIAGNMLGAPVEGCSLQFMENLAHENGDAFPLVDYWKYVPQPYELHNAFSPREAYTRTRMNGVPVDDDLVYTLLGLLVVEQYGPDFSTEDVAEAWLRYLPFAYTAEEMTLKNLKAGVPAMEAGARDNPFTEWIGADIRADPWGYLAPGYPELAAEMAYRDAYLSHRRQGIYGEMFFAAAIAAAFQVQDPLDALQIGLTEIPADCRFAQQVRWALSEAPRIQSYRQARAAVDRRFAGMASVHTINNACLTVFGLAIGGTDITRVIGETAAMGLDNDCTAATAGSIVGTIVGKAGIPEHWYRNFNNRIATYLNGVPEIVLSDVLERFAERSMRVRSRYATSG
ncbi:MAG TPA: ADP-ribosylglycohydrolase family protein [Candidatus Limnocylindrales bacterium]|nr:ADP-ribosylglycohydrolase family protein [Candidatus Limnocylindrales bacterium]